MTTAVVWCWSLTGLAGDEHGRTESLTEDVRGALQTHEGRRLHYFWVWKHNAFNDNIAPKNFPSKISLKKIHRMFKEKMFKSKRMYKYVSNCSNIKHLMNKTNILRRKKKVPWLYYFGDRLTQKSNHDQNVINFTALLEMGGYWGVCLTILVKLVPSLQ